LHVSRDIHTDCLDIDNCQMQQ